MGDFQESYTDSIFSLSLHHLYKSNIDKYWQMVTKRIFSRRVKPMFRLCWQFSFQFTGIKTSTMFSSEWSLSTTVSLVTRRYYVNHRSKDDLL